MKQLLLSIFFVSILNTPLYLNAHCEIPCGIYDDQLRINLLYEHVKTLDKSIDEIVLLSNEDNKNFNQIVRWVNNKETHANEIQNIVSQYFLSQRIKTDQDSYHEKLEILHQIIVYSMKAKQSVDKSNTLKLNELIKSFEKLYFVHSHPKK